MLMVAKVKGESNACINVNSFVQGTSIFKLATVIINGNALV